MYRKQPVFDSSRSGLPGHLVPRRARETQWQPPVAMLYISVPNPFVPPHNNGLFLDEHHNSTQRKSRENYSGYEVQGSLQGTF